MSDTTDGQNGSFRDRVKGLVRIRAGDLKPHPENWRTHPKRQREAVEAALAEVGFADALLVRETGPDEFELIDGHLRTDIVPDQEVPCLVLDVTEEEARKILATKDPLAGMAGTDPEKLGKLLEGMKAEHDGFEA